MTISPDDQLFAWVKSTLDGVTAISDIVASNRIVRDDWADSNKPAPPRIEYNPLRYAVRESGDMYEGQFGITIVTERTNNSSYGTGGDLTVEGDLWTLEASVISALSNIVPTLASLKSTPISFSARRRPTETPDPLVGRRLNFGISISTTGLVPLSGGDASIIGLPGDLVVQWYNIDVQSSGNDRFTDDADTVRQIELDRAIARVSIGVRIEDADGAAPVTLFPAVGSSHDLTFGVADGVSFTESVQFGNIQWTTRRTDPSQPQRAVLHGTISNGASPLFSGVVT